MKKYYLWIVTNAVKLLSSEQEVNFSDFPMKYLYMLRITWIILIFNEINLKRDNKEKIANKNG